VKLNHLLVAGALVVASVGARAEVFYTVKESTDTLYTIDTSTLVLTPIGALGVPFDFGDLAFDTSTNTMYMSNGWGSNPSNLYKVNLTTGAATLVGSTGVVGLFGLTYDPTTNKLFSSISTSGTGFYEVNKATGVATFIGNPGVYLDGLTYVGSTGDIAGLYAGPGSLHKVDRATGGSSLLSAGGGFVNNCGIAWGAATNTIYSIDWSGELYAFDVANSYARTTVTSGLGAYDGLAATSNCLAPVSYCTAKVNSLGCIPATASTGSPSSTAGSGFTVKGVNVRNNKSGLLFYGVSGQAAIPFQGGTLCVASPIKRTPGVFSGGSPAGNDCTGVYSIDFNAFTVGSLGGNPLPSLKTPGTVVDAQWWGRDPGFPAPNNTTLTNGLHFTMCP
jgi:hypothetical protein